MHRQEISSRKYIVQGRELNFEIACLFGRHEWIVSDDIHAEGSCSAGNDAGRCS